MNASTDTDAARQVPVEFTGQAGEYFKIWLPNLLLTIVTLGVYSPWAKVRNTQYLYGHVRIDGASFAYTADPLDILKGRALALVLFLLYILATEFAPAVASVFIIAFFLLFPWLVVQALRYRYRNTMYRNLRFDFAGRYPQAFVEYALMWLALIPTIGLAYPYIRWRQSRYVVANTRFGTSPFRFAAPVGSFYVIHLVPIGIVLLVLLIGGVLVATLTPLLAPLITGSQEDGPPDFSLGLVVILILFIVVIYLAFVLVAIYMRARIRNLIFNNTTLAAHGFRSAVGVGALVGLWITNTIALICTLGLAWPWVRVRVARYYARCTTLNVVGDLDDFVARSSADSRAFGEEMGEVLGVDIGL
ncbi:MAG: YjgN family protein [Gammaproteobacteria bacterium]|nr:YjgN family protein [Gammaproteobacteria bacterium]